MPQKSNKMLELIKGYATGLILVAVIVAVMMFIKHHH